MKQITLILVCMVFFTGANAQQKKIHQVIAACEALRAAMVDPTPEKLEALLDDSLSYGHSGGHIDTKDEFIQKLTAGKSDFVSIRITNQIVSVRGNTAFVRHELTAETNDNAFKSRTAAGKSMYEIHLPIIIPQRAGIY